VGLEGGFETPLIHTFDKDKYVVILIMHDMLAKS